MSRAHRQEATGPAPSGLSQSPLSQAEPLVPCAADALAEHWFTLVLRTWRDVKRAVLATGEPPFVIADRLDMARRRVSGILNGTVGNPTMRELHNMARISGYRLRVIVEKLPASADTHPKDGDSTEIEAPASLSGAVVSEASETPNPSPVTSPAAGR